MSVLKANRQDGKLQVLTKAMEMCKYTIEICKNERCFPKRYRWLLTQPIVREAVDTLTCIRRANSILVEDGDIDGYKYRRMQQKEAFAHAEAMLTLMTIAYETMSIETSRIEHWTGLVVETEKLIQAWKKSDKDRYKDMFVPVVTTET